MIEEDFIRLLTEYSDALDDRRRFAGLLKDIMPDMTLQTNLLINLYDVDIHIEIQNASVIDNAFIYRFIKRLNADYGVNNEQASLAVLCWCKCYGEFILGKPTNITKIDEKTESIIDDKMVYETNELEINNVLKASQTAIVDDEMIRDILNKGNRSILYHPYLLQEIQSNPNDLTKLGEFAFALFQQATDSGFYNVYTMNERRELLKMCCKYLCTTANGIIQNTRNRSQSYRKFACVWLYAKACFLIGDFQSSKRAYNIILEWDDLINGTKTDNGLIETAFAAYIDALSFSVTIGDDGMTHELLNLPHYQWMIGAKIEAIEKRLATNPGDQWRMIMLEVYQTIQTTPYYLFHEDNGLLDQASYRENSLYNEIISSYDDGVILYDTPLVYKVNYTNGYITLFGEQYVHSSPSYSKFQSNELDNIFMIIDNAKQG